MQKHFSGGTKEWLLILLVAVLLFAVLLLPLRFALADGLSPEEERLLTAYLNGEVIRIHVIANSDSPEDQQLKLKVRDALIEAFGSLLAQAGEQSSDAAFQMLQQKQQAMVEIARNCAAANGFSGSVQAEVGWMRLPAKSYGSVVLPEGDYRALRIILGEGKGQNWWCVLYPQLCLALSENEGAAADRPFWSSRRIFSLWLLKGI